MKELGKTGATGETETLATGETIDDGMREVLDDYSRKFLSFIQQERERIRKQVLAESERTLVEAQHRAKIAHDRILKEAQSEADELLAKCRDASEQIVSEMDKVSALIQDIKGTAEKHVEEFRENLRRQAGLVADTIHKADRAISESCEQLNSELLAVAGAAAELRKQLSAIKSPESSEAQRSSKRPDGEREEKPAAAASSEEQQQQSKKVEKNFVGTLNLHVYKGTPALFRRFREALARVPGLEISMTDDFGKDRAKVVVFINRPMPLLGILQQMSLVKSAAGDGATIEVVLEEADRWVG